MKPKVLAALEGVRSARRSAAGTTNGASIDLRDYVQGGGIRELLVALTLAVVSGTPTLDVKVQGSPDAAAWTDLTGGAFAQKSASGFDSLLVKPRVGDRYVRIVDIVGGGTPVVDFAVILTAHKLRA